MPIHHSYWHDFQQSLRNRTIYPGSKEVNTNSSDSKNNTPTPPTHPPVPTPQEPAEPPPSPPPSNSPILVFPTTLPPPPPFTAPPPFKAPSPPPPTITPPAPPPTSSDTPSPPSIEIPPQDNLDPIETEPPPSLLITVQNNPLLQTTAALTDYSQAESLGSSVATVHFSLDVSQDIDLSLSPNTTLSDLTVSLAPSPIESLDPLNSAPELFVSLSNASDLKNLSLLATGIPVGSDQLYQISLIIKNKLNNETFPLEIPFKVSVPPPTLLSSNLSSDPLSLGTALGSQVTIPNLSSYFTSSLQPLNYQALDLPSWVQFVYDSNQDEGLLTVVGTPPSLDPLLFSVKANDAYQALRDTPNVEQLFSISILGQAPLLKEQSLLNYTNIAPSSAPIGSILSSISNADLSGPLEFSIDPSIGDNKYFSIDSQGMISFQNPDYINHLIGSSSDQLNLIPLNKVLQAKVDVSNSFGTVQVPLTVQTVPLFTSQQNLDALTLNTTALVDGSGSISIALEKLPVFVKGTTSDFLNQSILSLFAFSPQVYTGFKNLPQLSFSFNDTLNPDLTQDETNPDPLLQSIHKSSPIFIDYTGIDLSSGVTASGKIGLILVDPYTGEYATVGINLNISAP